MPKIKIFLWQICHNALPVRGTSLRRGCRVDSQCPICLGDIETIDHLFRQCPSTYSVWELAAQYQWIPQQVQMNHTQDWIQSFGTLTNICNDKFLQRISFLLWSIWKAKNAVLFQNKIFNPMKCLIRAKKLSAEWRIRICMSVDNFFQGNSSAPIKNYKFIRKQSPNPGRVKLNFDGSLQNNSAVGGYILRGWREEILMVGAANYENA